MPEQLEITAGDGERRVVAVATGDFVLGSAADADVRVAAAGVEPRHLRFVRTGGGVRVEPTRAGATVTVNGEALFCKDLESGDTIELGRVRLRWLGGPVPPPAPRPTARRRPAGRAARAGSRPAPRVRRRGVPTWVAVVGLGGLCVAVGLLLVRHFSGSTWPSSPQHYVDLARTQLGNQQPQRALDTLAFALREATGATRAEALRLEADIRRLLADATEAPKLLAARREHDLVLGFAGRYLRDAVDRPAAREFVRLCAEWLTKHRDVCTRHSDGAGLLRAIQEQHDRHVALAALDQPDTAADVVFAARSRLRFQWRDYRGAVARLDAFLVRQPDDATVRAERDQMLADGEQWLHGRLRTVDALLTRGDVDNAARDLDELERWSVLPQWAPLVAERRQRLAGR